MMTEERTVSGNNRLSAGIGPAARPLQAVNPPARRGEDFMSTEQPWTVDRLRQWTTRYLAQRGCESARLDTEVLLAHALGCRRIDLYVRHDEEPDEAVRQRFRELVRRRVEGCPVAYLVGRKEFYSLDFEVGPAVLIPRPDTEWLVEDCLRLARALTEPAVLDVGTGSGCLAVTVAVRHKGARLTAVDVSGDALEVARRNAARHGVADRIDFRQGDLFAPLQSGSRFDFILSNPPYIPTAEVETLAPGVRDFEPRLALDGGGDGFGLFDRLVGDAPEYLEPGGYLLIEIGAAQEEAARSRIEALAGYELAPTLRDAEGRPRVLRARRRPGGG
jgi:release factor glutamine methyltransferase